MIIWSSSSVLHSILWYIIKHITIIHNDSIKMLRLTINIKGLWLLGYSQNSNFFGCSQVNSDRPKCPYTAVFWKIGCRRPRSL